MDRKLIETELGEITNILTELTQRIQNLQNEIKSVETEESLWNKPLDLDSNTHNIASCMI